MRDHTKTPWEVRVEQITPTSNETCYTVVTDEYDIVSPMLGIRKEEDARYIVHCVNNHKRLLEVLRNVMAYLPQTDGWTVKDMEIDEARTLLAELEAEKGGLSDE